MKRNGMFRSKLLAAKDRLAEMGIRWAIFAGAAALCYGSKREIKDIDILVKCEDVDKARVILGEDAERGFDISCGAEIETPQGKCSFFFDEEMIERIDSKELLGIEVPVLSVDRSIANTVNELLLQEQLG